MSESDIELPPLEERPLVTFALFAYNQEKYIREAVEGAFSQTYEPLEIILSDDCSTDRTFEIMQEMAAEYKGPHRLVLNRSQNNLGLSAHINSVVSRVNGELIVLAAGDDISKSHRTVSLVSQWVSDEKKADLLCSDYTAIDSEGEIIGEGKGWFSDDINVEWIAKTGHSAIGATVSWTKKLISQYESLPQGLIHEDQVMQFRAAMLGGIRYVQQSLIFYRKGTSYWVDRKKLNNSEAIKKRTIKHHHNQIVTANQQLQDALKMKRYDLARLVVSRFSYNINIYDIYKNDHSIYKDIINLYTKRIKFRTALRILLHKHAPKIHNLMIAHRAKNSRNNVEFYT